MCQACSVRKRQRALRTAKQHGRHDPQRAHEAAQEPGPSPVLGGLCRNLEEVRGRRPGQGSASEPKCPAGERHWFRHPETPAAFPGA